MHRPRVSFPMLKLNIAVSHIIWVVRDEVASHIFTSEALKSTALDQLVALIQSLTRLRKLELNMAYSFQKK
jgi:hypothetical protein